MKVNICKGFKAVGIAAGIKKEEKKELGLIYSDVMADVAGVFTKNRVQASCVRMNRKRIKSGKCRAVMANSGNANCCAGRQEMKDTEIMASLVADALNIDKHDILVASTGVIGVPMPMDKIQKVVPGLVNGLSDKGFPDFAESIMTTDTAPKMISLQGKIDGKSYTVMGIAKGSGMIHPNMATMLCFVCTDLKIGSDKLQKALSVSADRSFNRITVDGDTSTNDMAIIMANGMSGAEIKSKSHLETFQHDLDNVMFSLAKMIVKDGEGATKCIEIKVKGASSNTAARRVVDTIAGSNLVKTAFFGEDANWGRIIAAAGRAGVPLSQEKIDIYFDNVMMVKGGSGCGKAVEADATKVLKKPEFCVTVDLHMGKGKASVLTCDFSIDYVKINADYRS